MATRLTAKKSPATDAVEADESQTVVDTDSPDIDSLQVMMSELGGADNARVTVHRVNKNRTMSYVFACTPDEFSLDTLRDQYGGGDFRLYITKNGQLIKGGNRPISVEPRQQQQAPQEAAPSSGVAEMLAMIREMQAVQLASMQRAAAPANPLAGIDLPAVITAIAAAVTALRPPPAPALPPPPPPVDNSDRAINMLLKGIELAKDLGAGGGGGESSLMDVARDLMKSPMLAAVVQASAASPPRPAQPRPPQNVSHAKLPAPNGSSQTPQPGQQPMQAAPTPEQPPQQTRENVIAGYLAILVQKATEGADPQLYAAMILDNVDDETIISMLERKPTAVDALIADCPTVATQRQWFEDLVSIIKSAYEDDDEADAPRPDVAESEG
jgi:hypothetical protein